MNHTILYPGSFDPITNGHVDLIQRASLMFDKVIIMVATNLGKTPTFSPTIRLELVNICMKEAGITNYEAIMTHDVLLADYCRSNGIKYLLRGIRNVTDFDYEFQMLQVNRSLNSDLETIFLAPSAENGYVSSSMVKQIAKLKGDVSNFVPAIVNQILTRAPDTTNSVGPL